MRMRFKAYPITDASQLRLDLEKIFQGGMTTPEDVLVFMRTQNVNVSLVGNNVICTARARQPWWVLFCNYHWWMKFNFEVLLENTPTQKRNIVVSESRTRNGNLTQRIRGITLAEMREQGYTVEEALRTAPLKEIEVEFVDNCL